MSQQLHFVDYLILAAYFIPMLLIGLITMRRAGKSSSEFFLSGRTMPWWLLGFSLVATTFAADTPNLVTDIVRNNGVAGNWVWWAFLLTGMTTVFIYAKLWRRIGVMTDIEFYEVRYSGKSAAFVRAFRTIYLGLIVNTLIMATVTLAIVKILNVMLGADPIVTVLLASLITVAFSTMGGFSAVVWADFVLFVIAMGGSITAACYLVGMEQVGGLNALLSHENVVGKLSFFPDMSNTDAVVALLVVPLAVQWWSAWYPGSEQGGGSYVAQRMLAAKDETHAVGATLFFNFCHYALRPWPWILVGLASLIVFPDLNSLKEAFPSLPDNMVQHDMAYPAMLTYLPPGLFGLVLASLFAAYMSTIATHLNLGASYLVNDLYLRYIDPKADEKKLVWVARCCTVVLMILTCFLALNLKGALDSFQILLMIGAGTGLLFLLRWFWWRMNAFSEIAAMAIAFPTALFFKFGYHEALFKIELSNSVQFMLTVLVTTVGWVIVTLLTPPDDEKTLREFLRRTRANGPGWKKVIDKAAADGDPIPGSTESWSVPIGLLCSFIGCIAIYASLFSFGQLLYGHYVTAGLLGAVAVASGSVILYFWRRVSS